MTPQELDRTAELAADWLPGFAVEGVIGAGGFGTVFRARQLKLERVVAVKVIDLARVANPALAERFEAEAVTLGKFHHPNIVQVYDYGRHGGRLFIVMELLEGEDLGRRLARVGRLGEREAWSIARQSASALAHAAGLGVVHRDVKPSNLFLIPAPTGIGLPRDLPMVKVTDFGLALTKQTTGDGPAPGGVMGTPLYMAPEQCRGGTLDHRADIYGLGATVFHALAGQPPFDGATPWDVVAQKLDHTPTFWPQASGAAVALLAAMMAPDPARRIGSYEELIERIERLDVMREVPWPPKPRRRWPYAAGIVVALGVAAAARLGVTTWRTEAAPAPQVRYVSGGHQEALVDGKTLAGWMGVSAGGAWRVDTDEEGAAVFVGTGMTRRRFTPFEDYRVTIGLDLFKADAAEVHFALPAKATGPRLVLRVTRSGAALGTQVGDKGEFRPLGPAAPFPPAEWFDGKRPYLEARFERAGGWWSATFNGRPAGRVIDDGMPKAAEVRVAAEGGPARVDSVILEKLEVAKD